MSLLYFPIIVPIFAFAFVWFSVFKIKKISLAGVTAKFPVQTNLKANFKKIGVVGLVLFIFLFFVGWKVAIGFLLGAGFALFLGFLTTFILNQANVRAARAAERGWEKILEVSFGGGFAAGLMVVSFGLLLVAAYYFLTNDVLSLIGLAFGAGLISFFLKDNVLDTFETYLLATVSTMILGALLFPRSLQFILLPLILGSASILTSIIGSFFVRLGSIYKGIAATVILSVVAFYFVVSKLMADQANFWFLGLYGIAIVVVLMLCVLPILGASKEIKSFAKLYSTILAALASLILFFVYFEQVLARGVSIYNLDYVRIIIGVLLGGVASSLFVLSANASRNRKVLLPGLVIILAPILVGFILGAQALAGLLIGSIAVGFFTAITAKTSKINPFIKGVGIVALLIIGFLV
jgi:Na+/H+-translocating membrane pyrophosphatase